MDVQEFKSEFNLVYNNLSSNQAPGLDPYEISVYLTKAQEIVTDSIYAEFEKSETARRKLATIVVTAKLDKIQVPDARIIFPQYTTTFKPLTDVRYIINEQLVTGKDADPCIKEKFIKVQPILHDEINNIIENPYRFNNHRALRLDTSYNNSNYIEILTKFDGKYIDYYQIRYVKNPEPIMIYNTVDDGITDTINGVTPPNQTNTYILGSLPKETHRQIVEIAAKMAYADYKQ